MLALLALVAAACGSGGSGVAQDADLELHFLNVGKGDAVLIRLADGRGVLYDGGKERRELLRFVRSAGVTSLELVIASHNHSDHVGGLARVIRHYRPRFVMENGLPHTSRRYEQFVKAIAESGAQRLDPSPRTFRLGEVDLHIVPPPRLPEWGHNNNSIGLVVELGAFRASLLGDAEAPLQEWWLRHHESRLGRVNVHKASHHGLRRSDTRAMLERLRPELVVISLEDEGQFPHPTTIARYESIGATILRTDLDGTVVVRVDAQGAYEVGTGRSGVLTRTSAAGLRFEPDAAHGAP